jgi:hypothetical protein
MNAASLVGSPDFAMQNRSSVLIAVSRQLISFGRIVEFGIAVPQLIA